MPRTKRLARDEHRAGSRRPVAPPRQPQDGALVAWVIGGHALLGYSAVGGWAYDEVNEVTFAPLTELVLVAILGPSGLFVIGLFFFVAGLLTERAVKRHGWRRYVRDRMFRSQVRHPLRPDAATTPAGEGRLGR